MVTESSYDPKAHELEVRSLLKGVACERMLAKLDKEKWTEILSRPRKYLRGDALPAEICEAVNAAKVLVLSAVIGTILPDPVSNFICPGIGMTMMHPAVKRKTIRWAADMLHQRHVLANGEDAEELLVRLEVNTLGTQWIPLATFRMSEGEIETVTEKGYPPCIKFTQTMGTKIVGPSESKAESILRSEALTKVEGGLKSFIDTLAMPSGGADVPPTVEYCFWVDQKDAEILHQRIRVTKNGELLSESKREEVLLKDHHEDEDEPTKTFEVDYNPGPLGIGYEGSRVVSVTKGGQTEKGGVKVGMTIHSINGSRAPNDSAMIKESLTAIKALNAPFKAVFAEPAAAKPQEVKPEAPKPKLRRSSSIIAVLAEPR